MENNNPTNPNSELEGGKKADENGKLTFTQEELDALIQSKSDARVSQALKTAEQKNQAKVREAERLAKMDSEQRYQYELEQREQAIAEKERQLTLAENTTTASKILNERGISLDLVGLVVADDADEMSSRINLLDKAFKASVKAEVEKRLAGNTPKKNLPTDGTITKEQFRKMDLTELSELRRNQPELYASLKGK